MSEVAEASADVMTGGTTDDGITAGLMLRQAREAAGLHLAALAQSLKVPVRKLEALEDDRYDLLPDAVFVRALASSVCRTLKIDMQPVLQRLPQSGAPRLLDEKPGINAPFRAPGDAPRPSWLNQLSKPVVLVVIVLLLAALVLIFLPSARQPAVAELPAAAPSAPAPAEAAHQPAPDPATAEASPVSTPAPLGAAPAVKTGAADPKAASAGAKAPAQPAAAAAPTAKPVTTAPAAPPAAAAQQAAASTAAATPAIPAASAHAAPPLKGLVVFRANAPSWIEVIDAEGKPILRRLLEAGQSARANSGTMPLSVTVGSADTTEVDVRGKRFDLKPVSSGNVAHFEVK